MYTLNCKGKLLVIERAIVMGIINVTPDSFYSGSRMQAEEQILPQAEKMIRDGATIIDIGGQSTRPGSEPLSASEEAIRVLPAIEAICKAHPQQVLSVDTYHSAVARQAVEAGCSIVNDISSGDMDSNMIPTVAALNVAYIIMHMQGTPQTMQQNPQYENVVTDVLDYMIEKVEACRRAGLNDVVIDPGFGFGKTIAHNFQLLNNLDAFSMLKRPILAGLSRKATVYKTLCTSPSEALNGTTVLNTIALLKGANILRVHDVKEAMEAITLINAYAAQ